MFASSFKYFIDIVYKTQYTKRLTIQDDKNISPYILRTIRRIANQN